jgi:hypothetical protein
MLTEASRSLTPVEDHQHAMFECCKRGVTLVCQRRVRGGDRHGMQPADWSAILDFADQKLLKKPGDRKFDVLPAEELK